MMIAAALDEALRDVAPIHGVAIGKPDDKATWRIDFADDATAEDRAAAAALMAAFDPAGVKAPVRIDLSLLLERLTRTEKAAAGAFMVQNPAMLVDILEAAARGDFRADNPDTGRFTEALIEARVVTAERLADLLAQVGERAK